MNLKNAIRALCGDKNTAVGNAIFDAMESLVEDDPDRHLKDYAPDDIVLAPFRYPKEPK